MKHRTRTKAMSWLLSLVLLLGLMPALALPAKAAVEATWQNGAIYRVGQEYIFPRCNGSVIYHAINGTSELQNALIKKEYVNGASATIDTDGNVTVGNKPSFSLPTGYNAWSIYVASNLWLFSPITAPTGYNITKRADVKNGTLTAPGTAEASSSVTVTATPDSGYQLGHLDVYSKKDENKAVNLKALSGYQTNTHEGWAKLVDGNNKTKWGHVFKANTNPYIIVKASDPLVLKSYSLTTANDTAKYSGRNWKDWTIYGANFATDGEATKDSPEWKPVVTVTNNSTLEAKNYTTYNFTANATTPYQYYKITPTAIRGGNFIQMAELKMTGDIYEKATVTQDSSDQTKYTFTMPAKDVYVDGYFMEPVASVKRTGGATTFSSTLAGAVADWNAAGNDATLKLLKDVTTAGTIGVSGAKTLDLNGCGIRLTGNNNSVISVGKGANLTLNDSNTNTTHYITLNNWRGTAVDTASAESTITNGSGVLKVTGGYITGHYGGNNGGINVNAGTLTMNAGTICGNRATDNGGGVMLENNADSKFIMNGGTICSNWANWGAGVYIWTNATFEMKGGVITKNCGGRDGSGVLEHGKLIMSGGRITDNTGGGVARWASGTQPIELSGSAQVTGNTRYNIKLNGAGARKIAVTGALNNDASIGVTMDSNTGVFTNSSDNTKNVVDKFSSDNTKYRVGKNADGQLFLGVPVTVTFDMQGHGTQVAPVETVSGMTITEPAEPTESGWSFTGWFRDTAFKNPWDFANNVTQNMTLYARWTHLSASVSTAPTAKTLDSEAADKTLVTAGTAQNGIMQYSLGDNADIVPESWSTDIPSATDAGLYYVWYKAAGQNGYGDSDPACVLVTVSKAIAGVTAPKAKALTYNGEEHTLIEAGSTTSGTMQYALGQNAALAPTTGWSTSLPKGTDAGVYYVWYKAAGDGNHEDSEASFVTVTIDKAAPTTTAPNANTLTYTGEAHALTTQGTTSGGVLLYALGTDGVIAPENGWSSDIPTAANAGTYYVWYKVDGNDNYNGTSPECVPVTVGKAAAAELVEQPTAKDGLAYTGQNWELVDAPAGGSALLYALGENAETTPTDGWSASIPTGMDAGTYYVWYKTAEDENHNEGAAHPVTAVIAKATPTIQATDLKVTKENIAQINAILSVDAASWKYSSDNESTATVDADGVVSGVSVGLAVITITAEPVDSANYNSASVTVNVTVTNKDTQTLTFDENELVENGVVNKTFGDSSFAVAAEQIAGNGNISYTSSDATVATVDAATGEVTILKAGTATITATAAETETYEEGTAFYLLNVSKAVPEVTTVPVAIADLAYDNTPLKLINKGSSTPGTTIKYALGDEPVNWSTEIPKASAAGTYTVWYRVVGNENYTDLEANSIPVTIGPASINSETITVDSIPDQNPTGSQLTPKPTVTHRGTPLVEGTDYTLSYGENKQPGMGTVTLTGIGSYTNTRTVNFTITKPTYTVTFNAGDGKVSPISAQTDTDGKLSTLPTPTYSGFAFVGWYTAKTEGEQITAGYTFTKNTTIYARYVAHRHEFTYSTDASGATITATCKNTDDKCTLDDGTGKHTATLTIAAPTLTTYGQTGNGISEKATLTGLAEFNSATGKTIAAADIKYYKATKSGDTYNKGDSLASAPTDAGTYLAEITLSGVKTSEGEGKSVTATVGYTIAPITIDSVAVSGIDTPTATADLDTTATTATANVTLNSSGAITWDPAAPQDGKAEYAKTYKATVTAKAENNYAFAEAVTATVNGNAATVTKNQDGTLGISYTFAKTALTPVTIGKTNKEVDYASSGIAIPVEGMFTIPEGAGAATYSVENGTGTGTYDAQSGKLTVTKCGTFTVKVSTVASDTHAAGAETSATLTVKTADNPVTYPEKQAVTKTFSTSAQTATLEAAKNAEGELSYGITSQKCGEETVKYFTLDGTTLTLAANTPAGTYTLVVYARAAGNGNYFNGIKESTVTVTVNKASIDPTVKMDGWTAGETAKEPSLKDGSNPGNGTVTYTYAKKGENKFTSGKPTTAGQYTVKAEIAETDNYKGGSATADFTIDEAKPEEKPTTTEEKTEEKTDAVVTTAPKAQKLTYNGKAQALVKAGKSTGGKMQYALGKKTKATGSYSADIPTGTKAKTYYVWYKVKGDKNHNDSKAACVKVTIAEAEKEQKPFTDFRTLRLTASKRSKDAITLKWRKYADADGYLIYGCECGEGSNMKLLKTIKGNKNVTWTQKKLKKGTYYKYKVVAYKNNKGKKQTLVTSKEAHTVTKGAKTTAVKAVKVNKTSVSLKKGKTFQIKASEVKDEKKKKIEHHRDICYESSNEKVATVNKNGKVKGVKKGTATIFVYSETGHYKTVKVTVK